MEESKLVGYMCQYLVGISWCEGRVNEDGEFIDQPTCCQASGFLLQPHERVSTVALVTAGHVIEEFIERAQEPGHGSRMHSLVDNWGPEAGEESRIPFNIFEEPNLSDYRKDAGVDVAIISLPDIYARMLLQNTTPITKVNWLRHLNEVPSFDEYFMLGLPNSLNEQVREETGRSGVLTTWAVPTMTRLCPCEHPKKETVKGSAQQLCAKIVSPKTELDHVAGMSGGPIFGFRRMPNGDSQCWPVAIQSGWYEAKRIVIASYLAPIADGLEKWIEAH